MLQPDLDKKVAQVEDGVDVTCLFCCLGFSFFRSTEKDNRKGLNHEGLSFLVSLEWSWWYRLCL